MTHESTIKDAVIAALQEDVSIPVIEFGSPSDETAGAQVVIQCDRPAIEYRDKMGRAKERNYTLAIHLIVHSHWLKEDGNDDKKAETLAAIDSFIEDLELTDVDGWLDGGGQCTAIHEQDGTYSFSETFDDFATVAEIHIME